MATTSSSSSTSAAASSYTSVSTVSSYVPTTSLSSSVVGQTSTVYETSSTSTIYTSSIETSSIVTSIITEKPSTTVIVTTPAYSPSVSVVGVTSIITETPTVAGSTLPPVTVIITSTQPDVTVSSSSTKSSTSSSSSSSASAIGAGGSSSASSSKLSTGATVAIGVIIPVVVLAALALFFLWFWRRRKSRKADQEQRKNEMAEYSFNPNHDPTLPVGAAAYVDGGSEEGEGYRGWGTTSSARKASTTLGSNSRPANGVISESGSQPGGYGSPVTGHASEAYSGDPLVGHPSPEMEAVGALGGAMGGAAAAGGVAGGLARHSSNRDGGVRRGPSNASSAYTTGVRDVSEESDRPDMPVPYYHEEVPYNIYNEPQPSHGPYGDGSYGGGPALPIVRDVQARRNTQIQRVPTFPQQAGGIAQNF